MKRKGGYVPDRGDAVWITLDPQKGKCMSTETALELQRLIETCNHCWLQGRPQEVRRFLHPDVVFAGPQFQRLVRGIEACVKSYEDFVAQATVYSFQGADYVTDLAGPVAIVTYRWTIDYQMAEKRSLETGREILVLVRDADRWLIAWRAQQGEPVSSAG